jgi:hypothetical protein
MKPDLIAEMRLPFTQKPRACAAKSITLHPQDAIAPTSPGVSRFPHAFPSSATRHLIGIHEPERGYPYMGLYVS